MNMGYGFLRATYGQKPKGYFAYLKGLYGEQLMYHFSKGYVTKVEDHRLSESDWTKFRQKVQQRVREENTQRIKAFLLSLVITVAVLFAMVWLVREWFGI